MRQAAKNAAFAPKALLAPLPHKREIENFYGNAPLKSSITSFRKPHRPHPPLANLRNERVDTQSLTRQARAVRQFQSACFKKAFIGKRAVLSKQHLQFIGETRVLALEGRKP